MRYPILSFDGDDLFVFENPDDVSRNLEVYDVDYPEVLFDSDGRLLIKTEIETKLRCPIRGRNLIQNGSGRCSSMLSEEGDRTGLMTRRWRASSVRHKIPGIRTLASSALQRRLPACCAASV